MLSVNWVPGAVASHMRGKKDMRKINLKAVGETEKILDLSEIECFLGLEN